MKIDFHVVVEDGTEYDVTTSMADVIALEEHFDIDASQFGVRQRATWMTYLAWHALKRKGVVNETFDAWKLKVEGVESPDGKSSGNE
jgi:hypothetical protein